MVKGRVKQMKLFAGTRHRHVEQPPLLVGLVAAYFTVEGYRPIRNANEHDVIPFAPFEL
jgi:hypothetical protein